MERLEAKKINGRIYYYYSEWAWVNGKCRRVWQKYLGKLENIVKAVDGVGQEPLYAEVFQWGLPVALWKECCLAEVVETTDNLCPKRDQGMSTGEYLAIAAVNRAICPNSKRSMWDWFSQTVLLRHIPNVSKAGFSSQRFWDHMDRINADTAPSIWKNIVKGVVKRENIDVSSVSYDGTNFYTFINTFNTRSEIARRGKNKQGRDKLRQISYALFCCADNHMPLFYDVYEGNRNDAKQFPLMLQRFHSFCNELFSASVTKQFESDMTLIFDKGNNSAKNFSMLDSLGVNFVGSVKLDEHKDLAMVSNGDAVFVSCRAAQLEGTKAFRVTEDLYGRERVLVVSYNQNLFNAQWLTLQNDITGATEKLSLLQQKLKDRANGVIKRGRVPEIESVEKQCNNILKRQYMKRVIKVTIMKGSDSLRCIATSNIPSIEYAIDADAVHKIADTRLGKNIIITSRRDWDDEKIILTYRSQFIIEDVFKEMKDRNTGSWWPLHHWTDSKIKVHALYCTIALLLRALILRRVRQTEINISLKRILTELDDIREVVNIYPRKRRQKIERKQVVLTKTSEIQQQLLNILKLNEKEYSILG